MEDDRLPYIQIHDKLGIVEIRADDARSGNWLTRITYLLEILGSESWCCLNEGRTPSTRGEAALIQSCSTTRSDKRVRISPVPRSAGPFHEERCETVSAFSFLDVVSTRIRLASTMSRNTYQQITFGSSNIWGSSGFGSRDSSAFASGDHVTFDRFFSSRWRDYGIFQSFPLSLIVFNALSLILGDDDIRRVFYVAIINNKGGSF